MSQHPDARNTAPAAPAAQAQQRADALPMTPAENAAFMAGRRYQEPISVLEGSRMGRLSWFCFGLMVGFAVLGSLRSCGLAQ